MDENYGAALRRCRTARGWSLRELAGRVHIDHSYLSAIERGIRRGSAEIAVACDEELNAGGRLRRLHHAAGRRPVPPVRCHRCRPASTDDDDGGSMTLDALVDGTRLALATPTLGACDQLDATVHTLDLTYSQYRPRDLVVAVHRIRRSVVDTLDTQLAERVRSRITSSAGWLSALLGNLSYHLDEHPAAAAHWATAIHLGDTCDDRRLIAWTRGAQSMLARADGDPAGAAEFAVEGLAHATTSAQRAQLLAWAVAPAAAAQHRNGDAALALDNAFDVLADAPGRFGIDHAEAHLHAATTRLYTGDTTTALHHADASAGLCEPGRPGWAAAVLTAAMIHARRGDHSHAITIAGSVLDAVPPDRLRATSRRRLDTLTSQVSDTEWTHRVANLPSV